MKIKILVGIIGLIAVISPWITKGQIVNYDAQNSVLFSGVLSGIQNNQNTVRFKFGGNNFGGLIFLRPSETLSPPETIQLGSSLKTCYKRVKGIYYDNQRGMRFRPLDNDTLNIMKSLSGIYDSLSMVGGLYYGCDGPNDMQVYGDISHIWSGYRYELLGGVTLDFPLDTYQPTYELTLLMGRNAHGGPALSGYIFDSYGRIGEVIGSGMCVQEYRGPNQNTVCTGTSFTQTNNCGITQTAIGTKQCDIITRDDCTLPSNLECANDEGVDESDSHYDDTCCAEYIPSHSAADDQCVPLEGSTYSSELEEGYLYAYDIGATTMCPITEAGVMLPLLRKHLAKMMSVYAMVKMGRVPDLNKPGCTGYTDIDLESPEMIYYMQTACQLEIMGMHPDGTTPKKLFDPNLPVPRTEFGTVMSRLLFGEKYQIDNSLWKIFYKNHLQALKDKGVMQYINPPIIFEPEIRGYVWLMMMRADNLGLVQLRTVAGFTADAGSHALLQNTFLFER